MPPLSIMSIAGFGEIGLIELDDQGDLCGASGLPLAHILATRVGPVDHLIAIGKVGAGLDGGQFECADTGDVLLYRKNEGDTYISVKADYPVPLFTKRLRQATMHKYTVNLLTLWWMPIDEQDLQDIPGFYRRLFQESECSPASGFAMESPLSRTPK